MLCFVPIRVIRGCPSRETIMPGSITNCYDPKALRPKLPVEHADLYRPEHEWTYSHHTSITFYKGRFYTDLVERL